MTDDPTPLLAAWQNFYVVVGSAAAALVGVQFVVITLVAAFRKGVSAASVGAFATPTVVHLSGALLVAGLLCAPWSSLAPASALVAAGALAGLVYDAAVYRRARRHADYAPVWEDWLWHTILPSASHLAGLAGALFLQSKSRSALVAIGGAALALLLVGVHNAWDAVTHIVVSRTHGESPEDQ